MNNKLYYQDSYKIDFPSEIIKIGSDETGNFALLSESYFYPESGGQPSDIGKINDVGRINDSGQINDAEKAVEDPFRRWQWALPATI